MPNAMYLRKSRAEEKESTEEVLKKHRSALCELASKSDIIVTDIYEEVVSGESIAARPEMIKLLDAVQNEVYDAVLCMDIDRLGRGDMADQGVILNAFRESGTLIMTPDKVYDLTDEIDEELTEFKAFMARREYKMIRKRMRRGLMQTIQNGGYVANAPYGYRQTTVNKMPTLEIVPEEARFIHYIYDTYMSGVGAETISQNLNAMGSVPRRNSEWNRNTVRNILRNPTFAGKIAWNRVRRVKQNINGELHYKTKYLPEDEWLLVDGLHPAIITWEQWQQVQQIRKGRYIPSTKDGHTKSPFAGLMICTRCGKHMQMLSSNNTNTPYLTCITTACTASAKMEYVEETLISSLEDILHELECAPNARTSAELHTTQELLSGVQKELSRLDSRVPRLYEFLEDGTYDRATFKSRMETLDEEKTGLLKKQADLETKIEKLQSRDTTKVAAQLRTVLSLYPTLDAEGKNHLLKTVIDHVDYTKPKKTKPRDFTLEIHFLNF